MPRLRGWCPLLFTLMLFGGSPASAAIQAISGEVPIELAIALLGGQSGGTQIFVGELPPELEAWFPLGQLERVVGGLVRGSGGTVVVEVLGTAPAALSTYRSYLQEQGWQRPTIPQDQDGGFLSTSRFSWDMWCGERYSIRSSSLGFGSGTYLRIRYAILEGARTACNAAEFETFDRRDPFGGLRFPSLEPPPDAVVTGRGGGGSSDNRDTEATLESNLPSELIFEHYARQLTAAGWVPEGRSIAEGLSIGRWRTQDNEGRRVVGVLAVWALSAPNSYKAWARVDRPSARR